MVWVNMGLHQVMSSILFNLIWLDMILQKFIRRREKNHENIKICRRFNNFGNRWNKGLEEIQISWIIYLKDADNKIQ